MPREKIENPAFPAGLARFMDRKKLTLEAVGSLLNCSKANAFNLRAGRISPSYGILCKLLENGMTMEEAFGGELAGKLQYKGGDAIPRMPDSPLEKAKWVRQGLQELLNQVQKLDGDG